MMRDNLVYIVTFIGILITMLFLTTTGITTGLLGDILSAVLPKETNIQTQTHEVQSIEFKGEETFWADKRKISFDTDEGVFVYPHNSVTFQIGNENTLSITITKYDNADDKVVVYIPPEQMKDIRNSYAAQYSQNIEISEQE